MRIVFSTVLLLSFSSLILGSKLSPMTRVIKSSVLSRSSSDNTRGYILKHRDGSVSTINTYTELHNALQDSSILSIHASKLFTPTLDSARSHSLCKNVHSGTDFARPYKGNGVIIGVVDNGFDYTHPSFRASDGSVRILRAWNQRDTLGTPPANFTYGSELKTETELVAAKHDSVTTSSHGNGVAAIAGGSIIEGVPYYGIAPESEFIFVTTTYESHAIIDAIDYIFTIAEELGKPAVVNLSLASAYGPHDGTSAEDIGIAQHSHRGPIIAAAANSGGYRQHIEFNLSGTDTLKTFTAIPWREKYLDFWGTARRQYFKIQLTIVDSSLNVLHTLPWIDVNTDLFDTTVSVAGNDFQILMAGTPQSSENGNPEIVVFYSVKSGNIYASHDIQLNITGDRGKIHGWNRRSEEFSSRGVANFEPGDNFITIGDGGATSKGTISVGAYTTKMSFNNWLNEEIQLTDPKDSIGWIASFSSRGPTADGRSEPDIAAPGFGMITGHNSFQSNRDSAKIAQLHDFEGRTYPFAEEHGTSQATPVVTGAVALLLEIDPTLTWEEVLNILQTSATKGSFIDETYRWGAGKLNIEAAVRTLDTASAANSQLRYKKQTQIRIQSSGISVTTSGNGRMNIYTLNGKNIRGGHIENGTGIIDTRDIPKGIYVLQIRGESQVTIQKVVIK